MIQPHELDLATEAALAAGVRVLQGYRLADTDEGHVSKLLGYMAPAPDAVVADIGCGFGEVARLMHAERPDLGFVLVNNNALQLSHCPPEFGRVQADMHALPLADASVDVVMLLYALCHADPMPLLREAARITRFGGDLFVYDYARVRGDNRLFEARLNARAEPMDAWIDMGARTGWRLLMCEAPDGSDALFRRLYANDAEYDLVFGDLVPVVWKMRRC